MQIALERLTSWVHYFEFSGAGKDYEEDDLYDPEEESFEESSDDEWIMEDEG